MSTPYTARICAALPGDAPIELARFKRSITAKDVAAVTDGLSACWEVFGEYVTPERQLIAPRIEYYRPTNAAYSAGIKLKVTPMP